MKRNLAALAVVAALAFATTGCEKLKARDNLNRGVQAYKNAQYTQAVEMFEKAVQLDPTFATARLYLAMAYYLQYVPGAECPEKQQMSNHALEHFQKAQAQEPSNEVGKQCTASIYLHEQKWATPHNCEQQ